MGREGLQPRVQSELPTSPLSSSGERIAVHWRGKKKAASRLKLLDCHQEDCYQPFFDDLLGNTNMSRSEAGGGGETGREKVTV